MEKFIEDINIYAKRKDSNSFAVLASSSEEILPYFYDPKGLRRELEDSLGEKLCTSTPILGCITGGKGRGDNISKISINAFKDKVDNFDTSPSGDIAKEIV